MAIAVTVAGIVILMGLTLLSGSGPLSLGNDAFMGILYSGTITSMLFIVVVLLGRLFVELFLNSEYQGCLVYLYFLAVASLFTQQSTILNVMILQNKKTLNLSLITIISGIIGIALNALLIPKYGSIMAAIDSMVVGIFMFAITWVYSKKNYYVKFNFGNIWAAILIICFCFVIDYSIDNVYLGSLYKLGMITVCIFVFTKINLFSYPILGVVINKALKKVGIRK